MNNYLVFFGFMLISVHTIVPTVTIIENGLSYDDVLLVPQQSIVQSRRHVSTKTRLTKNIELNIPIISSNMDTVTEAEMAIAMAQLGGIGVIHRFNTIEQQVRHVEKVKRYRNAIIKNPLTIPSNNTLEDALHIMKMYSINGLLVVDDDKKLVGILTSRDVRFRPAESTLVSDLMTPKNKLITGHPDINISQAKELMSAHKIEKLPLVYDDWTIAGLITSKDITSKAEYPNASVDHNNCLLVGAAIGVREEDLERAAALINARVDVLVLDIAHGHSILALDMLKKIKTQFPHVDVIAGNVATAQGTRQLIEAGADSIKVGIGPGSICTTRIVSGSGYPQLSAVINCAQEADHFNIPVIADGGIRFSGDIVKAIGAGASTVMLGNLLAGTDESPGIPFIKNGKKYKVIRGMASFGANLGRNAKTNTHNNPTDFVPEGIEGLTPYKGSVDEIMQQLIGGLLSGMSYCGVTTVEQLRGNGIFVQITSAGIRESHAHDVLQS
jgi:IMP dehydrogenase